VAAAGRGFERGRGSEPSASMPARSIRNRA
jgi:hypothetical protein